MVKIEKEYLFEGPGGRTTLRGLSVSHRQLIIYHFMFDPTWEEALAAIALNYNLNLQRWALRLLPHG